MRDYYFVASALPPLRFGVEPELKCNPLCQLLQDNLTERDYEQVKKIRLYYDLHNLRALWLGQPLDLFGLYNANELEDCMLVRAGFPDYVYDFLDKYDNTEERLSHFPELMAAYFANESERAEGMLSDFLTLERETRLVFTAFRAKRLGRELATELQFEDPEDPLVAQILAQKDAPEYEPPHQYQHLREMFIEFKDKPTELAQALFAYRFDYIESKLEIDLLSLDRLLGYMLQLIFCERWMDLDRKKGEDNIQQMVNQA